MISHEKTQSLIIYSFAYCKRSTTCQWVGGVGMRLAETELLQSSDNFIPDTDRHLIITTKMLISVEGATIYGIPSIRLSNSTKGQCGTERGWEFV